MRHGFAVIRQLAMRRSADLRYIAVCTHSSVRERHMQINTVSGSEKEPSGLPKAEVKWGDNPWRGAWPNPAGLNFNFYRLLELGSDSPIASVGEQASEKRIAVIGAGIAGVTAARELVRCGFKNVHVFEATERIGGRLSSQPVDEKRLSGTPTTYELGA